MAVTNRMPETVVPSSPMPRPGSGEQMPPQGAAAPAGTPPAGGGVKELVTGINESLMELLSILGTSNVADESDRQMLAQIIMQYRNFVTEGLGKGPAGAQAQMPKGPRESGGQIQGQYVDQDKAIPA